MKKKILILYAQYGSGHKSIAEYVAKYIIEHNKKSEVMVLDMTSYANFPGKVGVNIMKLVAKYRPEKLFDFCYTASNHKLTAKSSTKLGIKSYDNKELRKIIRDFDPDVCISSHFYCSNIITYYNKLGIIKSKLITIITDYHSHEIWTINHKVEDAYVVSNEVIKKDMIRRGIPKKKIFAFGLPLLANKDLVSKEVIKRKYNIRNNKKVVLFFGGSSSGSMYYYNYLKTFIKNNIDCNLIFVSGHNEKLRLRAQNLIDKEQVPDALILGYTNDVANLLKISDYVISKPGGATVTECLEYKVPMILVPGVGGQEKHNARFVVKNKYGYYARSKYGFSCILDVIERSPKILQNIEARLNIQHENKSLEKINNLVKKI